MLKDVEEYIRNQPGLVIYEGAIFISFMIVLLVSVCVGTLI